jgi:hypothetical protein
LSVVNWQTTLLALVWIATGAAAEVGRGANGQDENRASKRQVGSFRKARLTTEGDGSAQVDAEAFGSQEMGCLRMTGELSEFEANVIRIMQDFVAQSLATSRTPAEASAVHASPSTEIIVEILGDEQRVRLQSQEAAANQKRRNANKAATFSDVKEIQKKCLRNPDCCSSILPQSVCMLLLTSIFLKMRASKHSLPKASKC